MQLAQVLWQRLQAAIEVAEVGRVRNLPKGQVRHEAVVTAVQVAHVIWQTEQALTVVRLLKN